MTVTNETNVYLNPVLFLALYRCPMIPNPDNSRRKVQSRCFIGKRLRVNKY